MQPAVKYFGEGGVAADDEQLSDFVDPEDDIPRVVLFGDTDEEEWQKFTTIADDLREFARFGRTSEEDLIQEFCGDVEDDVVKMYRKFDGEDGGASTIELDGDYTDRENIMKWVTDNSLPLLDEWNPAIRQRIQNRGLPIVWIHIDSGADTVNNDQVSNNESVELLKQVRAVAQDWRGQYTFTYIDSMTNEKFAKELGATTAPEVMILSQNNEVRRHIKEDDVAGSIRRAIGDYTSGATQAQYNIDDDDSSSDEDYDDDDEEVPAPSAVEVDGDDSDDESESQEEEDEVVAPKEL